MSRAPTGGHPGGLGTARRSPAVRVSRRPEDAGSRLAAILLGPAAARLGLAGLVRRRSGGRALDLGDLAGLGLLRLCLPHPGHLDHRCAAARLVPDLSRPDRADRS